MSAFLDLIDNPLGAAKPRDRNSHFATQPVKVLKSSLSRALRHSQRQHHRCRSRLLLEPRQGITRIAKYPACPLNARRALGAQPSQTKGGFSTLSHRTTRQCSPKNPCAHLGAPVLSGAAYDLHAASSCNHGMKSNPYTDILQSVCFAIGMIRVGLVRSTSIRRGMKGKGARGG